MVRLGLRFYFKSRKKRFELVGEAADGSEVIDICKENKPDVILMDFYLPDKSGLEVTRDIYLVWPSIKVIIMTGFDDVVPPEEVLKAGAVGLVAKTISSKNLDQAIQDAFEGRIVMDRQASQAFLKKINTPSSEPDPKQEFTEREIQTLELIAEGLSNPEIAQRMNLALATVATYVRRVLVKLEALSRAAAIANAFRKKIVG